MNHGLRTLSLLSFGALLSWAWIRVPPALTRGPYLQSTSDRSLTLVCDTDSSSAATLRYGTHAGPPWDFETSSPSGRRHVFELTGLRPETRYAYELTSGSSVLARDWFRSAPPEKSRAPFRFLAWGDSGTGSADQLEVAARMEAVLPGPDFALGLGDLVYDSGAWEDYDPKLFTPYARLLPRMTFWPTLGNHDAETENGAPYFDAFHLPTTSGAPGHPSNTEHYYSFDHGMAHFTCADSEGSSSSPGSAMVDWLEDDLADARARGKRWLVVFMHHPPYTRGTHDSDSESDLIRVREDLVPLFEAQGVDLVLAGHSHVYERSFLARNDAVLQHDPDDYTKIGSPDGTLYLVNGCGGKSGSGPLDHPLMARSYGDVVGFNLLDVSWEELRGTFVEGDGETTDLFTLHKASDVTPPRIAALEARAADELRLVFDEPVEAGTGAAGAENLANYQLQPARAVLDATLDSDRRTVVLRTASLQPDRGYQLSVLGVANTAGNEGTPKGWFTWADGVPGEPRAVLSTEVHTANVPARIAFSGARSTDPDGPLSSLRWDFGDGSPVVTGTSVEHLYDRSGIFTASLIATDGTGLESIDELRIRIHAQGSGPVASLTADELTIQPGDSVAFGSAGAFDPDGGALFVSWDFGDPASGAANLSQQAAPAHTYSSAGSYTVVLTVVDDEGSAATDTALITVEGSPGPSEGVFQAVADALVVSSSPTGNYGADPALRVRAPSPEYRTYVRFQVSGVTGGVGSAKLRLYATDGSSDGGAPYAVAGTWSEAGITWSNAPPISGNPLAAAGVAVAGSWTEYDVSSHVAGDGSYSFALLSSSIDSAYFSSREGAHPPELSITAGDPAPDVTAPLVSTRVPAPGAQSVPLGTLVSASFDEPVQGVDGTTFRLLRGATPVAASVSYDPATRTAALDPAQDLLLATTYTATLSGGISDLAQPPNALVPVSWSFTTVGPPPDTTPPQVSSREPSPGAQSVSPGTDVTARFDEPVQGVGGTTFRLLRGATPVAASVSYDPATRTATLDPAQDLLLATTYTATLSGGISDLAQPPNALVPVSWSFTTASSSPTTQTFQAVADALVQSSNPTANYGANPALRVRAPSPEYRTYVGFQVSGVTGGVSSAKLRLYATDSSSDGGAPYAVAGTWSEAGITWSNAPPIGAGPLAAAGAAVAGSWTEYDVSSRVAGDGSYSFALLSASIDSAYFSSREGAHPPELVVTIAGPAPDTTAPLVSTRVPASGAQSVPLGTFVSASFDEPVQGVDGTTFRLLRGATPVAASVSYDPATRTAALDPAQDLLLATTYTAMLSGGISDLAQLPNALVPVSWSFTTVGPPPDTTPPQVSTREPSPGAQSVSPGTDVTARFDEPVQGVDGTTFRLLRGATAVAASVSYDAAARTASLDPAQDLLLATTYTATLSGGISDLAQPPNALVPVSWSFTTASSSPTTQTFQAVADALVQSSNPTANYGANPALRVRAPDPEYRTYVGFQVSGVTGGVSSAKLRLYATDGSSDGGAPYAVAGTWSEAGITWSNAPPIGAGPLAAAGAAVAGSWTEYDVSSRVVVAGSYSFALLSASIDSAYFSSREGAHPPELVVTIAGPAPDTTAPLVSTRVPASGAQSVPLGTFVSASFDEPVQGVDGTTFRLLRGATPVAASVSYDPATRTAALDPAQDLLLATTYTATLSGGISDLAQPPNALVPVSWSFTTASSSPTTQTFQAVADALVQSSNPTANYGANPALRVRAPSPEYRTYVGFQVSGVTGSVSSAKLRLYATDGSSDGGAPYAVAGTWSEAGITWSNAPPIGAGPLAAAGAAVAGSWTEYDVSSRVVGAGSYSFALLSASIDSAYFSSREGAHPPELVVTIAGPAPDTTAPLVSTRVPAPGAQSVPLGTLVSASFDEPVQGVDGTTFRLLRGATPVAASVSYDPATRAATLDPAQDLLLATTYTATLSGGISDLAQPPNALVPVSWSFTTASSSPTTQTFQAVADALVQSSNPTANYGANPALRVRAPSPEYRTYVGFQVSGVTGGVSSAKLRLYATDGSSDGGAPYTVAGTWSEAGITWSNAPPIGAGPLAAAGAAVAGSWTEYDVSSHVVGAGSYSFALLSASIDSAYFSSREGAHPPELVVTIAGPAPDTTAPLVSSRDPAPGATSVPSAISVTVVFDEPMQGVDATTFLLRRWGLPVACGVSYDAATHTAQLDPAAELVAGAVYSVVLTGGITDLAALPNALAPVSWTFAVAAPPAATEVFPAQADALVKLSGPDNNHGADATLRVRAGIPEHRSYVRFQVGRLRGSVISARLRLYVTEPSNDGGTAYGTRPGWNESGITWNNAPPAEGSPLATAGAVAAEGWVEYDVTAHVQGDGPYSFVLLSASTDSAAFSSREGTHPPELLLVISPVAPGPGASPSPAPTLGGPARSVER